MRKALRKENAGLRRHSIAADRELIILRHKVSESLGGGGAGRGGQGESETVRAMQGELARLQEQVRFSYICRAKYVKKESRYTSIV